MLLPNPIMRMLEQIGSQLRLFGLQSLEIGGMSVCMFP
jgi:hypothetical protein